MLAFLSVVPGLPMFPFLVLSVVTWFVGKNIKNRPAAGADAKQKADGSVAGEWETAWVQPVVGARP
jgi:flagellar biosynthesis component FlhA